MASRKIILILLLSAVGVDAAGATSLSPPPRNLRNIDYVQASVADEGKEISADIPVLAESRRRLQEVVISSQCMNTLAASASKNGNIGQENYFVFTDGMSNGYFTQNNMRNYSSLPMQNKFAFVTLACQCHAFGGRENCCQGLRARIRVAGIDTENFENMNVQLQQYISDICSTTLSAIGPENILPTLPEAPADELPAIEEPPGVGDIDAPVAGGLSGGAIASIVLASAAVMTLLLYFMAPKRGSVNEDNDLEQMDQTNTEKENELRELDPDAPANQDSSDSSTAEMSHSDTGSMSTKSSSKTVEASNYYAKNNLLPGNPDEESLQGASSDASAIENGNWEEVAASAAACVNKNEQTKSPDFKTIRAGWEV